MDEDIIEANVRNAFAQGVDSVFVVDNASTDSTLDRALAAGALIGEVFDHDRFDGALIQVLVNAVAIRESVRCRTPHVWWMYLDSDEFPSGPRGLTIREYLASLDRSFRIVGATFMNHLPHTKPEYIPGFHPIDFQPYCYRFLPRWECECGHWKHPIQLFDRDRSVIVSNDGAHGAIGGDRNERWEPDEGIVVHHFQYREEERTRRKLELVNETRTQLLRRNQIGDFQRRLQSVDAVYKQRWTEIENGSDVPIDPHTLAPWGHLDLVRRWYSRDELQSAIESLAEANSIKR
jgi:glycosyltransferase involved in cell wall biosynthesis